MATARIMDAAAQGVSVRLDALPNAPHRARRFVVDVLQKWHVAADTVEAAELVASELATNAVMATGRAEGPADAGPTETVPVIRVRVGLVMGSVVVEVWDNSVVPPVPGGLPDDDSEGGRGLFLVRQLSRDWGYWLPAWGGKVVWAAM
jgi:anti-sigma regulatory factor (Ser/Thr protein kinase)